MLENNKFSYAKNAKYIYIYKYIINDTIPEFREYRNQVLLFITDTNSIKSSKNIYTCSHKYPFRELNAQIHQCKRRHEFAMETYKKELYNN